MSATARRIDDSVLLVGSLPFLTSEEAFRECSSKLRTDVVSLPDGEVGPRLIWVGYLGRTVYAEHPDLERQPEPEIELYDGPDPRKQQQALWQASVSSPTYQLRPGVDEFRFNDLGYADFAVKSYASFTKLKSDGLIPEEVRFQLCLPGTGSAIDGFFPSPLWPRMHRAYEDAIQNEIARVLEVIPADELAVQFDVCMEIIDLSFGDAVGLPLWPQETYAEKFERHSANFAPLGAAVPDDRVLFGYHLCYGTLHGWPMSDIEDLGICVEVANAAVAKTGRRVDYIQMPVIKDPEDAFFSPLAGLDVGETVINLGMVHGDGVDGFRNRAQLASRHLPRFGISSVCGFGREPHVNMPGVLQLHHDCLQDLRQRREDG
jgi:hypothetical protein